MDRNVKRTIFEGNPNGSLSARRAWIEIRKKNRPSVGSRAWIEIIIIRIHSYLLRTSLSARRAWIEILRAGSCSYDGASLSARRAWIEIIIFVSF